MLRQALCCLLLVRTNALKAPNASKTLATRARGAGAVVAVSSAALVAVSIDVNTLHLVAPSIDDAARHWAANHAGGNDNSLGRVLSDIAPGLGVPCAAASLALVARRGADALRIVAPLGVGFGAFVQGLSGVLKDATQRVRPDPLHHSTYSFPSSHTASAAFLAAAFLAPAAALDNGLGLTPASAPPRPSHSPQTTPPPPTAHLHPWQWASTRGTSFAAAA